MYTEWSIFFICIEVLLIGLLVYLVGWKDAMASKKSLIYTIPVVVVVYALYAMASVYNGEELNFFALFALINPTLKIVSLDLDYGLIQPLASINPCFQTAMILACVLALLTVVFGVMVLFGTMIANAWKKHAYFHRGGDIVLGYSSSAVQYLKKHPTALLWVESLEKATYNDLIKNGFVVHRAKLNAKTTARLKGKEYHFIVFRDSSYSYAGILSCFEQLQPQGGQQFYLHLEANVHEIQVIREKYLSTVDEEKNSFILPFCRYELMARRFLIDHPITKYIPRDFFNDNLTLKPEKEINVVFLGFGKVNYELFKLMSAQFQFAKEKDGTLCSAPVHYYILENNEACFHNEHFICLLNEYKELFTETDLPPAERICDLKDSLPMDAHSAKTRKLLRSLVNKDNYTYFIISMSEDFEDAAFAYKLKETFDQDNTYKIFVRAKSPEHQQLNEDDQSIVFFGETDSYFSHENIVNDDLRQLAQNVNDLYHDYTQDSLTQLRCWQRLPIVEQYSNLNAAINIYFKLALMGFTLKKGCGQGLNEANFKAACPNAFMPKDAGFEYFSDTQTANVLAFIEHSRWNAYYLLTGYKPLPFDEFVWSVNKKGFDVLHHKDIARRRHACLTTYAGLKQLIDHKYETLQSASHEGKNVGEVKLNNLADIYRYDYMVIDNLYEALTRLDYSIIKR